MTPAAVSSALLSRQMYTSTACSAPGWRMLAPELVDEHIPMNRLVRVQQQDRQQGPLLEAADVNAAPVDGNLKRPEKAIVDHFPTPEHSEARRSTSGIALTAMALPPAM